MSITVEIKMANIERKPTTCNIIKIKIKKIKIKIRIKVPTFAAFEEAGLSKVSQSLFCCLPNQLFENTSKVLILIFINVKH